jgi:hypothetical protein
MTNDVKMLVAVTLMTVAAARSSAMMPVFEGQVTVPVRINAGACNLQLAAGRVDYSAAIVGSGVRVEIYSGLNQSDDSRRLNAPLDPEALIGFSIELAEPLELAVVGRPQVCQNGKCHDAALTYMTGSFCTPGIFAAEKFDPVKDSSVDLILNAQKRCAKFFYKGLVVDDVDMEGLRIKYGDHVCDIKLDFAGKHVAR